MSNNRNRWIACGVVVVVLGCIGVAVAAGGLMVLGSTSTDGGGPTPATGFDPAPTVANAGNVGGFRDCTSSTEVPYLAVVQILAIYQGEVSWTGSGTIFSPDGYILTNAHVVLPEKYYPVDQLAVSLTIQDDQPPTPSYYAEVIQADARLDLAVIRIHQTMNGGATGSLDLPCVPLGNANDLSLGDSLTILGYPGIGGDTITLTRGDVGGFTSESPYGDRAFIKTSATIAGGNSGGLAADEDGNLVGVPTQLGYGGDDQYVDCRVLEDTNRDGVINDDDNCIPTGGFINALRPVNLALPLIEAARRGEYNVVAAASAPPVNADLPEEGGLLLFDDFSIIGDWGTFVDEDGYVDYVNQAMEISIDPDNTFFWTTIPMTASDVILFVDYQVTRATGEGDFGLMCRYIDRDNFYALEITEDGYYAIWMYWGGEYHSLMPNESWEYSELIPQDGGVHTVAAACVGNTLILAVDGEVLFEVDDFTHSFGDVGVIAGTWETGGLTVSFDNFEVQAPGN